MTFDERWHRWQGGGNRSPGGELEGEKRPMGRRPAGQRSVGQRSVGRRPAGQRSVGQRSVGQRSVGHPGKTGSSKAPSGAPCRSRPAVRVCGLTGFVGLPLLPAVPAAVAAAIAGAILPQRVCRRNLLQRFCRRSTRLSAVIGHAADGQRRAACAAASA